MLYRNEDAPTIWGLKDIRAEHYTMFGGQIATPEFKSVFDLYMHFSEENQTREMPDSLPRWLEHGDCIVACFKYPDHIQSVTFALLSKQELVKLQIRNQEIGIDPRYTVATIPIKPGIGSAVMRLKGYYT